MARSNDATELLVCEEISDLIRITHNGQFIGNRILKNKVETGNERLTYVVCIDHCEQCYTVSSVKETGARQFRFLIDFFASINFFFTRIRIESCHVYSDIRIRKVIYLV